MKLSAVALCGSALTFFSASLAQAQQTTTFEASSGNTNTDFIWELGTNWNNGVPDSSGTSIVHIGNFDAANLGVFINSNPVIGSLTFDNTLTGSAQIQSAAVTLTVNGAIVNNSNFVQDIDVVSLVAGGSSTWNAGTGGLVINDLTVGTNKIQVTGSGGVQLISQNAINISINSATSFGSIGPVTVTNVPINITTSTGYAATAGDFFQLLSRNSTLSGLTLTNNSNNSITAGSNLIFVSTLLNKGILYVAPSATATVNPGATVITTGNVLPVGNDTEFNPAGGTTGGIVFSGGELLTNNNNLSVPNGSLDTGGVDGAAFSTIRPITIETGSAAIIAATTGTTGTYTGAISDQGGAVGTLTIGDATNAGLGVVDLNVASTFADATNIIAGATLELGNANAVQDSTVTVNATNGITFAPTVGTFTLGGLSGAGNETLADTGGTAITLQVGNNNGSTTYSGVLSGTGGALTKLGTGTLTLSSAQTYTGTTTVSGGTLKIGTTNGIASGNNLTTAAAGTFDIVGHSQTLIALSNGGTVTSSAAGGVLTIGNGSSGAGSFTGAMNVIFNDTTTPSSLTGTFTNTGTVTLNANGGSTISIGTANNAGTVVNAGTGAGAANVTTVGTSVTGVTQNSNTSTLTVGTLNVNTAGTTLTSGGTQSLAVTNTVASTGNLVLKANTTGAIILGGGANNAGTITNSGTGAGVSTVNAAIGASVTSVNENSSTSALVLNGAGTYGALNIQLGTVKVGSTTAVGTGTVTIGGTGTAGTLDLNGLTETVKGLVAAGTPASQTITNSSANAAVLNYTGATSTFGGLIQNGTGTTGVTVNNATANLTLSGANTYTGPTTVTLGTLKAGVATVANTSGAFGDNSAVSIGTGTLDLAGFATQIGSLSGAGTVIDSGASTTLTTGGDNTNQTYSGVIAAGSTTFSLTKTGVGTETLSGANTYTGTTTVLAGVLAIGANNSITSGGALTAIGGTFDLVGHTQILGLLNNGGTVTSSAAGGALTIGAGSTGAGNFTGTMNVTFNQGTAASALTGNFTNTGNLTLNANGSGTTGTIGITSANNVGTITNSGTGGATTTIGTVGASVTGVTQASSTSALTVTTLNADPNAGGTTLTSTGTSLLSVTNAVAGTGTLTLDANSTGGIALVGGANNVGTIVNAGTGAGVSTVTGAITGNLTSVTENGTSTLVLNGADTFGSLNITKGTVQVGNATAVGAGTVTIGSANAGTLDLNGLTETVTALAGTATGTITNTNATAATLNYTGATMSTFAGLIKNGTGTTQLTVNNANAVLTLTGANTYTGLTTITAGKLVTGVTNAIASGDALTTAANGTLDIDGTTETLGAVTNGGTITSSVAGGNLTIGNASNGAGSYTGTMNVLFIQGTAGAALASNFSNTGSVTLNTSGTGSITETGSIANIGNLILSTNTFAGTITVASANNTGSITNNGTDTAASTITAVGANVTGITQASNISVLNVGTLNLNANGDTLTSTGSVALNVTGTVSGAANLILKDNSTGSIVLSGPVSNAGTITNSGTSTGTSTISGVIGTSVTNVIENSTGSQLVLSGANTYTGATTVTAGTLKAGIASVANVSGAFGDNSAVTVGATGVLDIAGFATQIGSLTGSGSVTDSGAAAILTVGGDNSSPAAFTGTISDGTNPLSLTKIGTGTETLSHANTYSGTTAVNGGTLAIGVTNAIKSGDALTTATGATFDVAGFSQTLGAVTNNGTLTSSVAGGALSVGSGTTGTGSVTGTLNLTLAANGTGAIAIASANNTGSITNSGTGAGASTVALVNSNVSGITQASSTSALNITTLNLNAAGTTLTSTGTSALNVTGTVSGAANLVLKDNSTGSIVLSGPVSNAGTVTNSGTSTGTSAISGVIGTTVTGVTENSTGSALVLSGANTYTSATTVTAGTLKAGVASVAGTSGAFGNNSAVTVSTGGTLDVAGFATQIGSLIGSGSVTDSGAATTLSIGGDNTSPAAFTGTISDGTGALSITKIGTGTETLAHANTYTGITTVTGGTLKDGIANAIKSGDALTTGASGIFDVAGFSQTLGAVTNNGNLTSSAAGGALTVGSGTSGTGSITGTLNLTLAANAAGAIAIASANNSGTITNSGTGAGASTVTLVNSNVTGVTQASNTSALNVTTLNLNAAGTTVTSTGTSALTVANQVAGTANIVLNDNSSGAITLTAGANNQGTVTNSGTGTGTTTLGAIGSSVTAVNQNSASSTLLLSAAGPATLNIQQGTVKVGTGTSVGTGTVTLGATGSGTLDLSGQTEIINKLATAGTAANQTITNNSGTAAVLDFTGASSSTFGGMIKNGTGTTGVTVNNAAAVVTLSGANTYTGATTVSAGTLNISGSTGTSAIALNAGLLNVTGTVGGTVSIASGAVLTSAGTTGSISAANLTTGGSVDLTKDSAIGTLHIGSLTTTGGAMDFEIGTGGLTQADKITTGTLSIGASTTINLANLGGNAQTLTDGLYTLLSYSGSASGLANLNLATTSLDNQTLTLVISNTGLVQVDVEAPVSLTTYTLTSSSAATRVATGGSTTVTTTITNTGSADTLDYSGLGSTVATGTNANAGTLGATAPNSGTAIAQATSSSGSATYTAPNTAGSVIVTPTVATATNTTSGTNSTRTNTGTTTINVVANRTENASSVSLGRVIVGQTTGNQTTTVSSATGQDSTLTRTTLAAGTQNDAVTNGTVTLTNGTSYTFGGTNDATNSTSATVKGTFTSAGNQSGAATYTVQGEGLSGENVNSLTVNYTADAVNNRTETATSVDLGRVIVGQTTGSQSTTVSSATGQDSTLTRTTLAAGTQHDTVTDGTVTLTEGTSYTFGGANDATNSTTAGITGSFTTAGVQSGTANYTLTGEGLTGETVNPVSVTYTADAVNNRTESSTAVALGRVMVNQTTASQTTTVSSVTGDDTTLTRTTLAAGTQHDAVTNGTVTLTNGTAYTFGGTNDATNSTTAGVTGSFTTAGNQSGTASFGVTGEGLTGEQVNPLSVAYTADAVNNRSESATSVNLGRVLVGVTSGAQSTTVSSVTNEDNLFTRTTLAAGSQAATGAQGTVTLTNGTSYTFGGTNDATNSTTASLTGNFTTAGMQAGTATYSLTGEGLTGEVVNNLSVAFTADAVNMRTVTNGATTNLGTFHTGATISVAANAFTSSGLNATTTSVQVAGGTGTADANGVTLTGSATNFTGAASGTISGNTQTFGGTITNAVGGTTTGTFTLGVTTLENGGAGLTGETAYSSVSVAYTATVYTGQGVWNTNGGGSWGTVVAPLNWQANGGAPGLDANFTNTDSATFGSALTTGTANILLGGDNPSLNAITFNNTNTASYNIEGSGGGSTGTLTLNGNGTAALLTDSATGTQTINAPIILAANGVSINVSSGSTLGIGGVISGTGALATATGTGTTTLTGANTYSGATTVGTGSLLIGNGTSGSINNASAVSVSGGAILGFDEANNSLQTNNIADAGTVQGLEGAGIVNALSGIISGAGGFTQVGTGTTVFAGANTYNGPTAVNAGDLQIGVGTSGSIGAGSAVTVASLATITFDEANGSTISNNITSAGTVALGAGAGITNTFSGMISGTGPLVQEGTGTSVLTGANNYSGNTTIGAGTVVAGSNTALGTGTVSLFNGTSLDNASGDDISLANSISLNGGVILGNSGTGGSLTLSGPVAFTSGSMLIVDTTTTISGLVSGNVVVGAMGSNVLTLTNVNNSTNNPTGTTTVAAGALQVANPGSLPGGLVTLDNSTALDYTGAGATLTQNITVAANGSATISNTGGGTLTLTGTQTKANSTLIFSGGAFIDDGTITGGSASSFNSDLDVTSNSTMTINVAPTYFGPTRVFGNSTLIDGTATLPVGTVVDLGDTTDAGGAVNTFNMNGNNQTVAGINTIGTATNIITNTDAGTTSTLTLSGLNSDNSAATSDFNGIIQDGGATALTALAVTGGTHMFTGNNTYSGGTTVSGGTVIVGNANAFGLLGANALSTVTLHQTGGRIMTDGVNHVINVAGSFSMTGGVLVFGINTVPNPATGVGANNDVLNVGGTVNIGSGATLALNIASSVVPTLMKGSTFEVITSSSAVTIASDAKAEVLSPAGFQIVATLNPSTVMVDPASPIVGNGDDVYLTITSTSFALSALLSGGTPDENEILNNIDKNINSSTNPQLTSAITQALIGTPTAATAQTIADSFNPAKFGGFVQSNIVNNAVFSTQEIDTYLASGRSVHGDFLVGNGGIDSTGLTVVDPTMDPALAQTGSRMLAWSPAPFAHGMLSDSSTAPLLTGTDTKDMTATTESLSGHQFSTFVVGNVVLAQNFSQPGIAHSDSTTGGVQLGADYRVTPHLRTGVMFGFNHTDASLDNTGSKATIDSYAPGGYISYADGGWYANAIGNYGFNSYTEDRAVAIGGLSALARGAPTGDQLTADLDGGYDFHYKQLTFGPLAGLEYTHLTVDSYNEDGAGALGANLGVGSQAGSSLRSRLGGHISFAYQTGKILLTPHLDASWQHEFMNQTDGITGQFTGAATPFSVTTTGSSRDSVLLDGGLNADITGQVTIFGDYLIQAGQSNYFGQSVQAGVKIGF